MIQTVLIITSKSEQTAAWKDREQYVKDFATEVESLLENTKILYTTYSDLEFSVVKNQVKIYDTFNALDLKNVAFVHFKNWQYETGEAPAVARYLQHHGVQYDNSEVGFGIGPGKLVQMVILAQGGVPVPDTFYAYRQTLVRMLQEAELPKGFSYPLIMKANDGSRGEDNHLVKSPEDALRILANDEPDMQYVLQNFVENDGDYRFLYVGIDDDPIVFHRKAVEGSHLNNTSKGGSGNLLQLAEIPAEHLSLSRMAAKLLGREIGGVDILVDLKTGAPYVLEVNGTPALATGYAVDVKTKRMADYISRILEMQEEE